jgi:predicted ferric reductase
VLARYRPEHLSNLNVYVCGVKEMVDDIRGRLKDHALRDEQIIYEKYEGPDQAITDSEPLPEGVAKD